MFLDATTKSLELVLGGAITTNQLPIVVDYVDMTTTTTLAGEQDSISNSATLVTILSAPAASTQRKVNGITVYNADTVAATVTIRLNNNATLRPLVVTTLQVGDTLGYTDVRGWYVVDSTGSIKQNAAATSFTNITDSGNLNFTGTGNLITGDFSNPTIANRVMFQTNLLNYNTGVSAIPNGTGTVSGFLAEDTVAATASGNSARGAFQLFSGVAVQISSTIQGTGTYLPMIFNTGGAERMRIAATGAISCSAVFFPQQATTASAPAYVKGGMYFDTTLNKLRIGGATAWETVTSA